MILIDQDSAIKMLEVHGYRNIHLCFKDGEWKGKAEKDGEHFKVHVDGKTGSINRCKRDD